MKEQIVADGEERFLEANRQELETEQKQRVAEIKERYRARLEQAGFWQRGLLRMKMRRELRQVLDSGNNLYLNS